MSTSRYGSNVLQRLHRYLLPKTIQEVNAYLTLRKETAHLMTIFHTYFPDEIKKTWDQEAVLPVDETGYSEAEWRCIQLMEERLFPFAIDHLAWCIEEDEQRSPAIPLWPEGIDTWNRPLDDFEPGWQILLLLIMGLATASGTLELDEEVYALLEQARYSSEGLSLEAFTSLCLSEPVPLCYLPVAYCMIQHITNNAFLDPTDDMPCEDMWWDIEDITFLAEQWKEAKTMREQADALANWLAADTKRVRKAVELWNKAQES